jgi:dihydroorotate dehydrogenase (NAD+) catalytic subunit
MSSLKVKIGRIALNNPIIAASGCFGYGTEMKGLTDLGKIGAVTLKTVTKEPRKGNPPPRILDIHGGLMSSIGLMNAGLGHFLGDTIPEAFKVLRPDQRIVSIGGSEIKDYVFCICAFAEKYGKDEIAAIELNACCPNIEAGGAAFSSDAAMVRKLADAVLSVSPYPVIVKIIANFPNMEDVAKNVEAAGADAIHLSISPMGIAIDIEKRKPYFHNVRAPLSGPLVKPIGVLKVWELYDAISLPIIASGGVACAEDAIEYMMAGLSGVAVGASTFVNPKACEETVDGLSRYCESHGVKDVSSLIGAAHMKG